MGEEMFLESQTYHAFIVPRDSIMSPYQMACCDVSPVGFPSDRFYSTRPMLGEWSAPQPPLWRIMVARCGMRQSPHESRSCRVLI